METITRTNGNGKQYTTDLPEIHILTNMNEVSLAHVIRDTGIHFCKNHWGVLVGQPTQNEQIVTLLLTYNFKTRYYNNGMYHNTLFLKSDHHNGFDVDSICFDCLKHNNIKPPIGLKADDRMMC